MQVGQKSEFFVELHSAPKSSKCLPSSCSSRRRPPCGAGTGRAGASPPRRRSSSCRRRTSFGRERQLALAVTHLEAGKTESGLLRTRGSIEERRLRTLLESRETQLVDLVRELYELATAERAPGVVAHDARSRVFRTCALVYEQLGEDAFRERTTAADADAPPPKTRPDAAAAPTPLGDPHGDGLAAETRG